MFSGVGRENIRSLIKINRCLCLKKGMRLFTIMIVFYFFRTPLFILFSPVKWCCNCSQPGRPWKYIVTHIISFFLFFSISLTLAGLTNVICSSSIFVRQLHDFCLLVKKKSPPKIFVFAAFLLLTIQCLHSFEQYWWCINKNGLLQRITNDFRIQYHTVELHWLH